MTGRTLDAVLGRLLPDDGFPGPSASHLRDAAVAAVPDIQALLDRLTGFESLAPDDQDAALRAVEDDRTFGDLVNAISAAYYANPSSWEPLGYTPNVPERP